MYRSSEASEVCCADQVRFVEEEERDDDGRTDRVAEWCMQDAGEFPPSAVRVSFKLRSQQP